MLCRAAVQTIAAEPKRARTRVHAYLDTNRLEAAKPAPPVQTEFGEFARDVRNHNITSVRITQDGTKVIAKTTTDASEMVVAPKRFDLVQYLLQNDVGIEIVEPPPDYSMQVYMIGMFVVLALYQLFVQTINGGGLNAFLKSKFHVEVPEGTTTFADVAGIDHAKFELQEVVEFLRNPGKYDLYGAKVPKGILLHGPSGTGKTLLARACAAEAQVPFIACNGSDFVEMFVGVGAQRLRDVFKKASDNEPCIVFIDEIDSIGKKRGSQMGHRNDEGDQTLNQLLALMDGYHENNSVIVIAATNRLDVLDDALVRAGRFDRHVRVDLPDVRGREAILRIHTQHKPLDDTVNLGAISRSTVGFSGADLENLANEAAIYAARSSSSCTSITQRDFDQAFEKIVMGEEKRGMLITEQKKKVLAIHEAGHALMGLLMKDYDVVRKVSIVPRSNSGGATYFEPSEERLDMALLTKQHLEDKIVVALGGRVAEELTFGPRHITTGAAGDIQEVHRIAVQMVTAFGMSEALGPVSWPEGHPVVHEEIEMIVQKQHDRARKLMNSNMPCLLHLAHTLFDKETLGEAEIKATVTNFLSERNS